MAEGGVALLMQLSDIRVTFVRRRPVFEKKYLSSRLYEHPPLKGQFRISYASPDRLARSLYTSPCWLGCNCLGWKCAGNRDRKYIRNLWRRTATVHRARSEPRLVSKRTSQTPFAAWGSVVSSRCIIFYNISEKRIADRRLRILLRTRASQVLSGNRTILFRTVIISFAY